MGTFILCFFLHPIGILQLKDQLCVQHACVFSLGFLFDDHLLVLFLQHGVQFVRQTSQHVAYVVQHVASTCASTNIPLVVFKCHRWR